MGSRGKHVVPGGEIFVDSGAWIALAVAEDAHHQTATAFYTRLLHQPQRLVTTNLVVAEAYEVIRRFGGHSSAVFFLQRIRQSARLRKIYSDLILEKEAEGILERYDDQRFSYVDAVSFALMASRQISEAFAFDHHFETAGFTLAPLGR
jgi:predicted nucleic acid-binding protein